MDKKSKCQYENPLIERYGNYCEKMSYIWSPYKKFTTWRILWIALAEIESELGCICITTEQINELKENIQNIDFELIASKEKELKHDVMAHIFAFGLLCPRSKSILHLGATSCFVGDNTDSIQIKESLILIKEAIVKLLVVLKKFSILYKDMPTLGLTHGQPAQLVTVGKRCCVWMQDFLTDYNEIDRLITNLPFRGTQGTTGTQASFLELFNGDHDKVKELNKRISEKMGFSKISTMIGQTYSRKNDYFVLSTLSSVAQSSYKMCTDIRLLASKQEIEESFKEYQVGSSAMPYKRNPIESEKVCSLARYLICNTQNMAHTAASQWFERTLDDSSIRRIIIPESFLTCEIILNNLIDISSGLQVWPAVIKLNVAKEIPFMSTEMILMKCVKKGGNRQILHEALRIHSIQAVCKVKEEGCKNDLIERIKLDPLFSEIFSELDDILDPLNYIGRCREQVTEFIDDFINPILINDELKSV